VHYDLRTDSAGGTAFTLTLPDSETLTLFVSAEGYHGGVHLYAVADVRRLRTLAIPLTAAAARSEIEVGGLVYDASGGRQAPLAGAEVFYEYNGRGVFPDVSGSVRSDAGGRYRVTLPIGPEDALSVRAEVPGFALRHGAIRAAAAAAGEPLDLGLAPIGGVARIEPAERSTTCADAFTVTITNDGPPGDALVILELAFDFQYSQGVYGIDFTWDTSGIAFPLTLDGGEQVSFPIGYDAHRLPSRLFVGVISGARSESGAVYYGSAMGCGPCTGDCDGDDRVTIAELVGGVAIALGSHPFDACPALDGDGDGTILVNELVVAVAAALAGCE